LKVIKAIIIITHIRRVSQPYQTMAQILPLTNPSTSVGSVRAQMHYPPDLTPCWPCIYYTQASLFIWSFWSCTPLVLAWHSGALQVVVVATPGSTRTDSSEILISWYLKATLSDIWKDSKKLSKTDRPENM